jgi:hypothetical protein
MVWASDHTPDRPWPDEFSPAPQREEATPPMGHTLLILKPVHFDGISDLEVRSTPPSH